MIILNRFSKRIFLGSHLRKLNFSHFCCIFPRDSRCTSAKPPWEIWSDLRFVRIDSDFNVFGAEKRPTKQNKLTKFF